MQPLFLRGPQLAWIAACWPALTLAQAGSEPGAEPVPAPVYQPAWTPWQPRGVAQGRVDWAQANAEVGQFRRGHADLVRWESLQAPPPPVAPLPQQHERPHHPMGERP